MLMLSSRSLLLLVAVVPSCAAPPQPSPTPAPSTVARLECPPPVKIRERLDALSPQTPASCAVANNGAFLAAASLLAVDAEQGQVRLRLLFDTPTSSGVPSEYLLADDRLRVSPDEVDLVLQPDHLQTSIRLGVILTTGEDYLDKGEFVALLRPSGTTSLELLWTGGGDRFQRSMDSCILWRTTKFQERNDQTVMLVSRTEAEYTEQDLDEELARSIRAECLAEPERATVLTLAPKPLAPVAAQPSAQP